MVISSKDLLKDITAGYAGGTTNANIPFRKVLALDGHLLEGLVGHGLGKLRSRQRKRVSLCGCAFTQMGDGEGNIEVKLGFPDTSRI